MHLKCDCNDMKTTLRSLSCNQSRRQRETWRTGGEEREGAASAPQRWTAPHRRTTAELQPLNYIFPPTHVIQRVRERERSIKLSFVRSTRSYFIQYGKSDCQFIYNCIENCLNIHETITIIEHWKVMRNMLNKILADTDTLLTFDPLLSVINAQYYSLMLQDLFLFSQYQSKCLLSYESKNMYWMSFIEMKWPGSSSAVLVTYKHLKGIK